MTACAAAVAAAAAAAVLGTRQYGWGKAAEMAPKQSYSGRPGLRSIATGMARVQLSLNSVGKDYFPSFDSGDVPKSRLTETTAVEQGPEVCRACRMD